MYYVLVVMHQVPNFELRSTILRSTLAKVPSTLAIWPLSVLVQNVVFRAMVLICNHKQFFFSKKFFIKPSPRNELATFGLGSQWLRGPGGVPIWPIMEIDFMVVSDRVE